MTGVATAVMYACWAVVGLTWVAGAVLTRRRGPAVQRQDSRDTASWIAALVAIPILVTPDALWRPLTVAAPAVVLTGISVLPMATLGALWARLVLGTMWSSAVVTKEHHELLTHGPYRISRHPVYTAVLAMLAGTALIEGLGRWAVLFVVVAVLLIRKAHAEEQLLTAEFGDAYRRYQERVRQLVPGPRRRYRRSVR